MKQIIKKLIADLKESSRKYSFFGIIIAFMIINIASAAITSESVPTSSIESVMEATSLRSVTTIAQPKRSMNVVITAYSSTPDQTDDTPFITATGDHVADGIIAANFLPFGTLVQIPKYFGDKIFVVKDRMHKRFSDRVDVWFPDRESALRFGKRTMEIVIL